MSQHPSSVLAASQKKPLIPVCDHYAGSSQLILKSLSLQSTKKALFDITADCEDGAAVGKELDHAEQLANIAASSANQRKRLGVRTHPIHHPLFIQELEILLSIAGTHWSYITVPKINSISDLMNAVDSIDHLSHRLGLSQALPIHVLIESYGGLQESFRIAAHPRIECISFGLMDFVSEHGGAISAHALTATGQFKNQLINRAKAQISAACHAYGKIPSHNVVTDIYDSDRLQIAAQRAKDEFGFMRMWSIHPNQLDIIIDTFSPSTQDILDAQRILLKAYQTQWAPIQDTDNSGQARLHDRASYRYYWHILEQAFQNGQELNDEITHYFFQGD